MTVPVPDLLRAIVDHAPEGVLVADDERRFHLANPAACRLLGRPLEDLLRCRIDDILAPDETPPERLARVWATFLRNGQYHGSYRIVRPDGARRHIETSSTANVLPGWHASFVRDATDRRIIEEHARLLDSAVREAGDTVIITTAAASDDGRVIQFVNPAFTRLTGYGGYEVIGRSPRFLYGPRTDRDALAAMDAALGRGAPVVAELAGYRKDGTTFDMECHMAPIHGARGEVTHHIGIYRDVTERRRAAESLREARALAEAADHAKSSFLAAMSHELRTPLTAIIGFSELLEDGTGGPLTDRQAKYARHIHQSGHALLDLIDQVLDITRVETGRLALSLTPMDTAATLRDVAALVRPLAAKKDVALAEDIAPLPKITADAAKLKQVVFGLLTNGLLHTPSGGRLAIAARQLAADGDEAGGVEVAVTDSGPGIAPEDRERLLNDFGLTEGGDAPVPHARTGMGLALARKLIELHGGRLWLEAPASGGTTVMLTLPLAARAARLDAPPGPSPASGAGDAPLVLVVEDDPQASELLAHYLTEGGYRVARAFTAAQGHAMARTLTPFAMTLDPALPDGDGLDMLAELRAGPGGDDLFVVVVSVSERRGGAASLGTAAWIVKPVVKAELLGVLDRRRAQAGGPA